MVVETLPQARGMFDDRWRRWIVDFGFPDPDRGKGGRLLSRRATTARWPRAAIRARREHSCSAGRSWRTTAFVDVRITGSPPDRR